jgi:hypothetical protein
VSSIGYEVWMNCAGLTSVTIPNNVASLGSAAFYNCSNLARARVVSDSIT